MIHFKDNKNKSALSTRWAQMSKQEQIIEKKKMEIQAKLEAQKNAAALAAQAKLTNPGPSEDSDSKNIFSNDGSFMSQYKALLERQCKEKVEKEEKEKQEKQEKNELQRKKNAAKQKSEPSSQEVDYESDQNYSNDIRADEHEGRHRERHRRWGERSRNRPNSPFIPTVEDRKPDTNHIPSLMQLAVQPPTDRSPNHSRWNSRDDSDSNDGYERKPKQEYDSDSGHAPDTINSPPSGLDFMNAGPMGPRPVGPGLMGPGPMGGHGPMGPGPMGYGPMGPGPMGHGQMGHMPMGPRPMGSGRMGPGPMGPGPMGPGPMGPGPMVPGQLGSGPMGPGQMSHGPMGPGPIGLGQMRPGSMGPGPMGQEGMRPNAMGSGPMGPSAGIMPPGTSSSNSGPGLNLGAPNSSVSQPMGPNNTNMSSNSNAPPNMGPGNLNMPQNMGPNNPNMPPMPPFMGGPPNFQMRPNFMGPNGPRGPCGPMPPNMCGPNFRGANGPMPPFFPPNGPPNSMMPPNNMSNDQRFMGPQPPFGPNGPNFGPNGPNFGPNFRPNGPNFGPNNMGNMPFMPPNAMPLPPPGSEQSLDSMKHPPMPPMLPNERDTGNMLHPSKKVLSADAFQSSIHRAAAEVASNGDHWESVLKAMNSQDQSLWFLHNTNSNEYKMYREIINQLRNESHVKKEEIKPEDKYEPEFSLEDDDSNDKPSKDDSSNYQRTQYSGFKREAASSQSDEETEVKQERRKKRKSRWGDDPPVDIKPPGMVAIPPLPGLQLAKIDEDGIKLSTLNRNNQALMQYALTNYGTTNLSAEDWQKCEDNFKLNLLFQDMLKKRQEVERLAAAGRHKYEYDSDEDTAEGTWEHKLRAKEMNATERWADELTKQAEGKHHIGDFLPPEELKKFMEKYSAVKSGKEPDLSDYKEYKLREDNVGFKMLQKLGWTEGQGLGAEGTGIVEPVNKANQPVANMGLGAKTSDVVSSEDDEFDAYRKRMMLAYRFRPNPLNNPRRPYY